MRTTTAPWRAGIALSALALALTACGSDDAESSDGSDNPDLTGPAVKVGFLNPSGGAVPQPGADTGAQAAVKYINTELDGIGGRPIELVTFGEEDQTTA